ncbi:MAG: DUF763 domain-containing protein [Phycisphaeraceae bacterium]
MQRRLAQLPLHTGKAPPWLFKRMTDMAGAVTMAVVDAFGPDEMLRRLADPWWFQAFGCALGFDWHSSGLTTVTCGALKEAHKKLGNDMGLLVAGGKGGASRKTPTEIERAADRHAITTGDQLIHASRMSAKVDSAAVQDGYQLYTHHFFFTQAGRWCVVQQGMNDANGWARRYHWLGETLDDFVCEPHQGVQDDDASTAPPDATTLLNMVATEADHSRRASTELVRENPDRIANELARFTAGPTLFAPAHHHLKLTDVSTTRLRKVLRDVHEQHPADFHALLGAPGVGPATVRSLALLAELIYEAPPAHRDLTPALPHRHAPRRWADYSYAHGGKDGTPFPVDRETYDRSTAVLTDALRRARLGDREKTAALRRLAKWSRSQPAAVAGPKSR